MVVDRGLAFEGESLYRSPILPVDVIDTVGAGDTFDTGFIYGFLQGCPLKKTLKMAIACGSLPSRESGDVEG